MSAWSDSLPDVGMLGAATFDPARIEAAVREGYEAGFGAGRDDGFTAGYNAGAAAGERETALARRNLGAVLLALRDQLHKVAAQEDRLRHEFEAAVVDAALVLAEAIVGRELVVAGDPGRDALVRAVAVTHSAAASATVRLNPADAERLGPIDDIAPGTTFEIVPDPSVEAGGCMLVLGDTTVDAAVSAALARVREVLGR